MNRPVHFTGIYYAASRILIYMYIYHSCIGEIIHTPRVHSTRERHLKTYNNNNRPGTPGKQGGTRGRGSKEELRLRSIEYLPRGGGSAKTPGHSHAFRSTANPVPVPVTSSEHPLTAHPFFVETWTLNSSCLTSPFRNAGGARGSGHGGGSRYSSFRARLR